LNVGDSFARLGRQHVVQKQYKAVQQVLWNCWESQLDGYKQATECNYGNGTLSRLNREPSEKILWWRASFRLGPRNCCIFDLLASHDNPHKHTQPSIYIANPVSSKVESIIALCNDTL